MGVPVRARIIPARAGFTSERRNRLWQDADHPRSRGVYASPSVSISIISGSSPLARGLRVIVRFLSRVGGIIPARAGFTRTTRRSSWRHRDHPRSRGVYILIAGENRLSGGSSPLARGLPNQIRDVMDAKGIIPARAGFTYGQLRSCALMGDHPRSRGVYGPGSPRSPLSPGSSPLARGLPSPLR